MLIVPLKFYPNIRLMKQLAKPHEYLNQVFKIKNSTKDYGKKFYLVMFSFQKF